MAGVSAGQAFVSILANTTGLEKGLRRAQARLNAFGQGVTQLGTKLLAFGTALGAPLALGVKEFTDFESSLARIDVLLDENTKSLAEFRKEIEDLSVKFGVEKEILARGFEDILQAMIPATKATTVLNEAIKLSKIGFTDTATAVSALTTIINSYGIDASRAGDLSDILFTTVRRGKITFEDLAINIGNVSSIASAAGVNIKELAATIAVVTRNGVKAEDAITAVRAIMQSFIKPSKGAQEAAAKFGLTLSSVTLRSVGLIGALEKIQDLPTDAISRIFPNIRAIKGILPIIKDLKGFRKDIDAISASGGIVDQRFQKITKTLGFMFSRINQIGKRALVIIGEALEEDVRRLGSAFLRFANGLNKTIAKNKEMIKTFSKAVLAIITTGSALITLGAILLTAAIGVGLLASTLNAFIAIIVGIFNPITLLIALIAALGVIVVQQFNLIDRATKGLGNAFVTLKDKFGGAFDTIVAAVKSGNLAGAFKVATASIKVIWQKFIQFLVKAWENFKFDVGQIVGDLATIILSGFTIAFSAAQTAFVKFKKFFANGFNELVGGFKKLGVRMSNQVDTLAAKINEALSPEQAAGIADKVIAANTKVADQKQKSIDDETTAKNTANTIAADEELEGIKKAAKARLDALLTANAQTNEKAAADRDAAIKNAEQELEAAKAELLKATEAAKITTKELEEDILAAKSGAKQDPLKRIKDFLKEVKVPDFASDIKTEIRGSFSGFAIERASNQEDQIVKNTKAMAEDLKRLRRNQESGKGGAVFQ